MSLLQLETLYLLNFTSGTTQLCLNLRDAISAKPAENILLTLEREAGLSKAFCSAQGH